MTAQVALEMVSLYSCSSWYRPNL